jgi:transposase
MDIREHKGLQIAALLKVKQQDNLWVVPSQSGPAKYKVNPDPLNPQCTCPDFEFRQARCKHIIAVEITIRREHSSDGRTVITETVKVTQKTYPQDWPAYNQAQTNEKDQFQCLLHSLVKGVGEPSQKIGRPRLPFDEMLFAVTFKVFSTMSQRRFVSDMRDAHAKGYLSKVPHFNSISNYLESEVLTPYLKMLIEESSLPLREIERDFAVDSSGFSTCRFYQWVRARYTNPAIMERREWVKVHLMCGVKTNIVTAVEVSERYQGDSPFFEPLVEATSQNFLMNEVSADKAYSSAKNLKLVISKSAMPYIPFRANAKGLQASGSVWKRMYHFYSYNQERFMQQYHKRSNVESTFSMIKAKFGDSLRSKSKTAQINEALCKVLCHNLCCVIQSMYELNIKPEFWAEAA